MMAEAEKDLAHHRDLLQRYEEAIKNCRMEGYRSQEQARAKAAQERAIALAEARDRAERLTMEARDSIRTQVLAAKAELDREAQEIARGITTAILQKSA